MNGQHKEMLVTSLENTYWLTGVDGEKGFSYLFDDERKKICIVPGKRLVKFEIHRQETGGIILSIEEALQMAEEIQQIAEIYFGQLREYKKVDLELTRKRRKRTAPRKKGKS